MKKPEPEDVTTDPRLMSKSYRVDGEVMSRLTVIDRVCRRRGEDQARIRPLAEDSTDLFLDRINQLANFFSLQWQLAITLPGWPPQPPPLPVILEVEEVEEIAPVVLDLKAGDIKSKMTGAIAGMTTVKKIKPAEKPAPKLEPAKVGPLCWSFAPSSG